MRIQKTELDLRDNKDGVIKIEERTIFNKEKGIDCIVPNWMTNKERRNDRIVPSWMSRISMRERRSQTCRRYRNENYAVTEINNDNNKTITFKILPLLYYYNAKMRMQRNVSREETIENAIVDDKNVQSEEGKKSSTTVLAILASETPIR